MTTTEVIKTTTTVTTHRKFHIIDGNIQKVHTGESKTIDNNNTVKKDIEEPTRFVCKD